MAHDAELGEPVTLRQKTLFIVGATLIGLTVVLYGSARIILMGNLASLEEQRARQDIQRALSALAEDLAALEATAGDYAVWDDTYAFMEDADPAYIRSNLGDETFVQNRLNLFLLIDSAGQPIWGKSFDLAARREVPVPAELRATSPAYDPLVHRSEPDSHITGIVLLPEGPMLVSSWPVLTSQGRGPARGTLIMGRYLDSAEVQRLARTTHLSLTVQRFDPQSLPALATYPALSSETPLIIRPESRRSLAAYALLRDLAGQPALVLRMEMGRDIYLQGQTASYLILSFLVIAGGFTLLGLIVFLERVILSRLTRLSAAVQGIGTSGEVTKRLPVQGHDELADLARAVNGTLEALERSQEALRESQRDLLFLMSNLPGMVYRLANDSDRTIQFVSEGCLELTGYSAQELVGNKGLSYASLIVEEDRPQVWAQIQAAVKQRRAYTLEYRIRNRAGQILWVSERGQGLFNEKGELEGLEGFIWNITQHKRLQEQLSQAQKMETIGRLTGGVAHDFNNLLTAITGYASFARDGLAPEHPVREDIAQILKAAERATNLTRQLLVFSRQQPTTPHTVDLNNLIANLEKMLRRLVSEDIELITIAGPQLGWVRVDPGQIEQVITNLVVNAGDAMPGGGRLTIETANVTLDQEYARQHASVAPGEYVMLAVSDTGCGMSEEVKAHIFEPFFTTKEPGRGTGLGLATCYAIVKQSGGHIWFYSEPGKGTTFKIYLPRASQETETPQPAGGEDYRPRGSQTILLAEDEPSVRNLAARVLRDVGYTVLEAADGGEALNLGLQAASSTAIDLLVADVVLPQMSGQELAKQLKATHPQMKTLFISGYTDSIIARSGLLDTDVAFLQKPFTVAALTQKVREVLDRG